MIRSLLDTLTDQGAQLREHADMHVATREWLVDQIDELVEKGGCVEENHPYEKELIAMQHRLNFEVQIGSALVERMQEWSDAITFLEKRNEKNAQ